ncbi:hypothetical protein [Erwinia psidii]|uniref:Uncharacterized protein n=1 Tax=Erwinia psidii TaxID=69224 RepID=A0A3N6SK09_9GAMM|nr:hypothetical protein [Erwinia psidii]RQM39141.1 hypothetical protein EB241_05130 [Erwinia psidii]
MNKNYDIHYATALCESSVLRTCIEAMTDESAYIHFKKLIDAILNMDMCVSVLKNECNQLQNKLSEKEMAYDEIAQALLNTEIGKAHNRSNTEHPDILSHIDAVIIIQSLEQELQHYAVLDEIPFGAAVPNSEICELQQCIAELEMQLDFERSHKSDLQLACISFCAGITAEIQREIIGGVK